MLTIKTSNLFATCAIGAAMFLFAGCGKRDSSAVTSAASRPASPTTSAASADSLVWTSGETPGVYVAVQELDRGSNSLQLKMAIKNQSDNNFHFSLAFAEGGFGENASGIRLLDEVNEKQYWVLRAADGSYLCSHNIESLSPGAQKVLFAEFPLPPEDVQKITVLVPHYPPLDNIPIGSSSAIEAQPTSADAPARVFDLAFRVEDLGGKVESLQMKETEMEVQIDLPADVLFDFNKANILPKAREALAQAAGVIRQKAKGAVRIEGHTDSVGSDRYNQRLSERRAEAVKSWFIHQEGLRDTSFATQGFGASRPVAPNRKPNGSDDPEGRQKNRRVEIIIAKAR